MATNREYTITVSAVLGRSTAAVLGDFVSQAQRAKAQVDEIMSRPARSGGKSAAEKEAAEKVDAAKKAAAELERIREKENNQILRDVERNESAVARIKERYFREEQRRQEQSDRERKQRNEKIVSDSVGYMRKAAGVAARVAGEVVSGIGVDTSVSSLISKGVRNETLAGQISGYGYIEGEKGAAGHRQDPKAILADARSAANAAKLDTGEVLEGLAEFTKKSSELGLGRDILKDIAIFAKATGSDFKAVASSAGDLSKKLGDMPNKAEAVKASLSILAKEGKFGAIDFSDLAKLIPSVIGGANQFSQGSAAAISQLGVLLQITKSFGGAKNPAQAATSVASFVGDLTSKAGLKSLRTAGFKDEDIFADKGKTKLRSTEDIIVKALEMSGGDLSKMSAMFSNKRSGSVLKGFGQIYSEAEQKEKGSGTAAVRDIFKSYGAQTSQGDLLESFKVNTSDTASKVIEFNNKLEEVADGVREKLLPALIKLAPDALKVADAFGSIVTTAAEHPWGTVATVIGGSIAASIGKAAIGEAIGKAIAGGLGGKGLAIGAITATVAMAYLAIKEYNEEKQKAGEEEKAKTEATADLIARAQKQKAATGQVDADTMNEIIRRRADLEGMAGRAKRYDKDEDIGTFEKLGAKIYGTFAEGDDAKTLAQYEGGGAQNKADAQRIDEQSGKLDALIKAIVDSRPKKGEAQHVVIDNLPGSPQDGRVSH